MATKTCPTAAKSNVQAVWVALEDVSGVLQKPTAADYIVPRGNASMNQTPGTTNSEELSESLNILDLFQNAVDPGEASIPMYLRLQKDMKRMQGHALMYAAMGECQEPETATAMVMVDGATIPAGIDEAAVSIPLSGLDNTLPTSGMVTIGAEKITYTAIDGTTLNGCVRGEAGTLAAAHENGAAVSLEIKAAINNVDGIDDAADVIDFDSATGSLPENGTIMIGDEKISYTGISGNQLTGCTRGADGTDAATHADDDEIVFTLNATIDKDEQALEGSLPADATVIPIENVEGGFFPPRGVIQIEDEKILYTGVEKDENDVVTALTGCTRGYEATDAVEHADDGTITLLSRVYSQDICRNTVSIWIKNDNLVTFGSGGVVSQIEMGLSNEGGQACDFTLQFRRMGWAGRSFVSGEGSLEGVIKVVDSNGNSATGAYTAGGYVKNTTKKDDNNGAGYRIIEVDDDRGTIKIDGDASAWADLDQIDAWTPVSSPIGDVIESRDARIFVDGKTGKIREGSLSVGTPTEFLQEIGDEYPGESVDTKREITMGMNGYLRADDAKELGRGYKMYEVPVAIKLGKKQGQTLSAYMGRVKMTMPEIGTDGAAFTLDRTGTVLGIKGEDALYIVQE